MTIKGPFHRVGVIGKFRDASVGPTVTALCEYLRTYNRDVVLDESTAQLVPELKHEALSLSEIGQQCDLSVVVGGDGSILHTARTLVDYDIPLVGINSGRLGFLADISPEFMLETMKEILQGQYQMEERFLLEAQVIREEEVITRVSALNDVVVHKWNVARMIEFETYINDMFVNRQRSDGLIIATPTGSTAYALSGGGPLVYPTLDAMVLVPICPPTLSNRPIVVDGGSQIEIIISPNTDHSHMTCDGQIHFGMQYGDRLQIKKKEQTLKLIHPMKHNHFELLRAKLKWG